MGALDEVNAVLQGLLQDASLSKNIRVILEEISEELKDDKLLPLKINAALQKVEDLSLDPNLSQYARTQIWSLSTLLESAQNA